MVIVPAVSVPFPVIWDVTRLGLEQRLGGCQLRRRRPPKRLQKFTPK